jgi:heme/copper-type cytochrome/quinol oxidase subunit 3
MSEARRYTLGENGGSGPPLPIEPRLDAGEMGLLSFLVGEFFFFGAFIFTYIYYYGMSPSGPEPQDVLHPLSATISLICLVISGFVLSFAVKGVQRHRPAVFIGALVATILLGVFFILGTGREWHTMVVHEHVMPRTNLFSSNYFALTGFHLLHVGVGVMALLIVLGMVRSGWGAVQYAKGVKLVAWYWYFVVAVAIWVYVVVYYGYKA